MAFLPPRSGFQEKRRRLLPPRDRGQFGDFACSPWSDRVSRAERFLGDWGVCDWLEKTAPFFLFVRHRPIASPCFIFSTSKEPAVGALTQERIDCEEEEEVEIQEEAVEVHVVDVAGHLPRGSNRFSAAPPSLQRVAPGL